MTGSMYNRSVRMCKLMYEALNRMFITEIEKNVVSTKNVYNVLPLDWNNKSCYRKFVDSEEMKKCVTAFHDYKERVWQLSPLTAFWVSYLDMVTVLLNFIYSFRAGNWHFYLESIRSMLPWVFAYDCYNYSHYLTMYFVNMLNLDTYFGIYEEFLSGNFAVRQSLTNNFGELELEKVIEAAINKNTKSPGGTTSISNKVYLI